MQKNSLHSGTTQVLLFGLTLLSSSGQDRVHPGLWEEGANQTKQYSELTGARKYDGYSTGRAREGNQGPFASSLT